MHIDEPLIPNNSKGNSETNKSMVHRIQQKISQFRYYAISLQIFAPIRLPEQQIKTQDLL